MPSSGTQELTLQQAFDLAVSRHNAGDLAEAENLYRQILAIDPDQPKAHFNLGLVLKGLGRPTDAAESYRAALALDPEYSEALSNLGNVLVDTGEPEEAVACYRKAIVLSPDFAEAHNNLGKALMDLGEYDEAGDHYDQALALRPGYDNAEYNRSLLLLLQGDFIKGWAGYQKRLVTGSPLALPDRGWPQPIWDGSDINGKTILLYEEQGIGDSIQFIRFAKTLSDAGAKVVVEIQPDLKTLLATAPGIDEVFSPPEPVPDFDVRAPLMSLPCLLGTGLDTIPADVPYLSNAGDAFVLPEPGQVNIGLVWAGNPEHRNDRNRSIDVACFNPVLEVPDTRFYGLQVGAAADNPTGAGLGDAITNLGPDLVNFRVTAAAIEALDLVISVDTSVAHLAGALGKPVWLLLPNVPDFRWMLERTDSPWYPSMRIFRQSAPGDWDSVMEDVAARLKIGPENF